ncbi:MAG TPA: GNAT family N-acetyltransferase [Solirubrobacteraceae bacterium]|nr:GNAT family N-acetyltransferase [Solirubrobacteraceae bacterium]
MSEAVRLTAADQDEFEAACHLAFHEVAHPGDIAMDQRVTPPERTVGVREDGAIVATGCVLPRELTVPGGAVQAAGVSAIGVIPGHTRRGHLAKMMRLLLDDAHAAGEPVAMLWASEGAIYGRFGFGIATRAVRYDVQLDRVALRRDVALPDAPPSVRTAADALEPMRAVHDRVRVARPGMLDRPGAWWERRTYDPEHRRDGAGPLRAAVQPGPDGEPAGYALYAGKSSWDDHGPAGSVTVRELVAETPEARAGLWRFLLGLDLMRTLQWRLAPDHDPLTHLLAGNDAVNRRAGDGLFVRLLDVGAALSARTYAADVDLVLEVDDPFCPWNSGRHRLRDGRCERTDEAADLALGAEALGSIYLGGTPLTALAGAGRARELRPGALQEATMAFRGAVEPWCPEIF